MPADWISAGAVLLSWGATYFVHSTCLVAGVWLFLRIRHSSGHALREALWKTALVGGVATASMQMWLAPGGAFGNLTLTLARIEPPVAVGATARKNTEATFARDIDVDAGLETGREFALSLADDALALDPWQTSWLETPDLRGEFTASPAGSATTRSRIAQSQAAADGGAGWSHRAAGWIRGWPVAAILAITVGLTAIALGLVRCGWQTVSLRRRLARCQVIEDGPARALLDELRRLVPRMPEVLLLSAPEDSEPAALGVGRWTIVLPKRAALDLSLDELRALLAHELAHLVRGDSLWLCISRAVCSCLAFQPLNHLARREWQRAAEFLCDNWAVSRTGTPLALARCLTEVASWRLAGRPSTAILAATGRKSGLVDRIERLLDARRFLDSPNDLRDRRRALLPGTAVLAMLACWAPRVQLVVAGPVAIERSVAGLSRLAHIDAANGENALGEAFATDVAKPPASGERPTRDGELEAEAAGATPAMHVQGAIADGASILDALDRDLVALEGELEQLRPLLHENALPQAVALARRLRIEIVRLKQRREFLKTLLRRSVNSF